MDNDTHKGKRRPLSEVMKEVRKEQRLTQQRVAELTGLDQGLISRTESGKTTPREETIEKISDALGVDLIQASMQGESRSAPANSLKLGIHYSLFSAPLLMLLKGGRVESVRFACHRAPSGEPEWDTVSRLPETGAGLPIYEERELLDELDAGVFDIVVVSRLPCATEEGTLRCARLALHQGADILLWQCASPETPGLHEPRRLHDIINRTTEPLPVLYVQNSVADQEFWALSDQMRTRLRAEGVPNFSTLQHRLPDFLKALSFSYEPATSRLRSFAAQNGRMCTPVTKDDACYSSPKDRLFSHDVLVSLDFVAQHLLTSSDLVNGFLEQLAKATERLNVMLSRPGPGPEIAAMADYFSLDAVQTMEALRGIHPGFEFLYYPKWISRLRLG
jgi:transcriptional regulator with XRE-family HTH domain